MTRSVRLTEQRLPGLKSGHVELHLHNAFKRKWDMGEDFESSLFTSAFTLSCMLGLWQRWWQQQGELQSRLDGE